MLAHAGQALVSRRAVALMCAMLLAGMRNVKTAAPRPDLSGTWILNGGPGQQRWRIDPCRRRDAALRK